MFGRCCRTVLNIASLSGSSFSYRRPHVVTVQHILHVQLPTHDVQQLTKYHGMKQSSLAAFLGSSAKRQTATVAAKRPASAKPDPQTDAKEVQHKASPNKRARKVEVYCGPSR